MTGKKASSATPKAGLLEANAIIQALWDRLKDFEDRVNKTAIILLVRHPLMVFQHLSHTRDNENRWLWQICTDKLFCVMAHH
ncbi:MAG: hypothetical protein ACI96W_000946 [Paraglaciecola sp.]|jgi:hypothetical protein